MNEKYKVFGLRKYLITLIDFEERYQYLTSTLILGAFTDIRELLGHK